MGLESNVGIVFQDGWEPVRRHNVEAVDVGCSEPDPGCTARPITCSHASAKPSC